METTLMNQNEFLEELNQLRAEKASLERHVSLLNKCLSIEELKDKISHLEKKKEMIVLVKNIIKKLREQIEPLKYLKITLETKRLFENEMKQAQLKSFNESKNTHNTFTDLTKTDLISTHKSNNDLIDLVQTPSSSNSMVINDEILDEAIQFLQQPNVVTDHDVLNLLENYLKPKCINQDFIMSNFSMKGVAYNILNEKTCIKDKIQYIEPSGKDIDGIIKSDCNEVIDDFNKMNLKKELLCGIYGYGFEKPTAIQQRTILPCIKGHDVISQAQLGSGKTSSFSISVLQRIDTSLNECQALILAPTRNLVQHIQKLIVDLSGFMLVNCHYISGTNKLDDMHMQNIISHVVVGTPWCVNNLILGQFLNTQYIKIIVLDQADEMLTQGFQNTIKKVFKFLKNDIQVIMCSTIMPNEVLEMSTHFMHNPVHINLKRKELTLEGIKQFYIKVNKEKQKLNSLCNLCDTPNFTHAVIFCKTNIKGLSLGRKMRQKTSCCVYSMHAEMNLLQREQTVRKFCMGSRCVLITTDWLAKGLDMRVSLIINIDLPSKHEHYIHRIESFGCKGMVLNILTENEMSALKAIESFYNTSVPKMPQNMTDLINMHSICD